MTLKTFCGLFLLIIVLALLPVISVAVSSLIAEMHGCKLNEGDANPCIVLGVDMGGLLYVMFLMGWFGLLTLPVGVIALLVLCGSAVVTWLAKRWRRSEG